jgi:hypothetical protein
MMAKYRVAVEHIKTNKVSLWDVEAEGMVSAETRGLQENDRHSKYEPYLFEVVGVWPLSVAFAKRGRKRG